MPETTSPDTSARALRLGVAGPVGTGKSSLIATLCRSLRDDVRLGVITNDIYTDEDARFLRSEGVLEPERIRAVETGACPHTAIRDDVTANLHAAEDLEHDFAPLDIVIIESGGDNLTATFSPALVDAQIFVLDVAGGGDVARKGGPGIGRADLLVVNKTDLAPYVGVDVPQMVADASAARDGRAVLALSRTDAASVAELRTWTLGMLAAHRAGTHTPVDPGPMAPHSHADADGGWFVHTHEDGDHAHAHAPAPAAHGHGVPATDGHVAHPHPNPATRTHGPGDQAAPARGNGDPAAHAHGPDDRASHGHEPEAPTSHAHAQPAPHGHEHDDPTAHARGHRPAQT